jgi:undecaprenyl-diphosphatase
MLTIFQQIILGLIQGITEWLPISSSGFVSLAASNLFNLTSLDILIKTALFFHLGTFLAALIYFRKEVADLFYTLFKYKTAPKVYKKTFNFILIATIISGIIGILILKFLIGLDSQLNITGKAITFVIAILLLITGIIQLKPKNKGLKQEKDLMLKDSLILGAVQGLSTMPGLSRSGITVSTLLLRKFDDTTALKLSFLLSLPIVLVANIILNAKEILTGVVPIWGIITAFIFGMLTIHGLMKLSKKINFAWFVLIFGILMLLSLII